MLISLKIAIFGDSQNDYQDFDRFELYASFNLVNSCFKVLKNIFIEQWWIDQLPQNHKKLIWPIDFDQLTDNH